jgi:hypothetical protein
MQNGEKVVQQMSFPDDHSEYPGQPKRIKQVPTASGLYTSKL